MSVTIDMTYDGNLECTLVHGPSGDRMTTDAPARHRHYDAGIARTILERVGHHCPVETSLGELTKVEIKFRYV